MKKDTYSLYIIEFTNMNHKQKEYVEKGKDIDLLLLKYREDLHDVFG